MVVTDGIGGLGVASIAIDNSSQRFRLIPMQQERSQVVAKYTEDMEKKSERIANIMKKWLSLLLKT